MEAPDCDALTQTDPGTFADWCFRQKEQGGRTTTAETELVEPGTIRAWYQRIEK